MQRRSISYSLTFVLLILHGAATAALAEPLWMKLVPGQRVEANPDADYEMEDSNGPWMIVATTFSGEGAEDQARELVLELRRRYKLEAYTHEKTFDFTGTVEARGVDRRGDPNRMKYRRGQKLSEIAVLVGNYPTYDDREAQTTLEKIKHMQPDALDLEKRKKTSQTLAALRYVQRAIVPEVDSKGRPDDRKSKGPMGKAFITRNPLLPREFFHQQGVDEFVVSMNEPAKYSLLTCPGKYTLKVATFSGRVVLDQREVQAFETGAKRMEGNLVKAGEKAEDLTFALRAKGYEAYSFHDRESSIVTVGSFNSVGTPRADGKIEINPQIYRLMERFKAKPVPGTSGGFKVEKLIDISFDLQPEMVHVPVAANSDLAARLRAQQR